MSVEISTVNGVFMDGDNASYEKNAKKFLSEKALLARILKHLVAEFKASFLKDIEGDLIFLDKMKAAEKSKVLKDEYNLVLTPDMEKKLTEMGSLAEGIAERAKAEGKESAILATIRNLMETLNLTAQQAMDAMKIPVAEQARYAALL